MTERTQVQGVAVPPDMRIALKAALAFLILAEFFTITGISPAPHETLVSIFQSRHAVHDLGSFLVNGFLLLAFSRPGWRVLARVVVGGMLINGLLFWARPVHDVPYWYWFSLMGAGLGIAALVELAWKCVRDRGEEGLVAARLLAAAGVLTIYTLCIESYLHLSTALHPRTFDIAAYKLDGTLGFDPAVLAGLLAETSAPLRALLVATYFAIHFGFSIIYALQVRDATPPPVSVFIIFTVSAAFAVVIYHLCPITGPRYVFGGNFPALMPPSTGVHLDQVVVQPTPRNGMPSMHFGWALILWMQACRLHPAARACFAALAGLMALATLALGEHYLVDLVAAVPATVALQALCRRDLPWDDRARWRAVGWGMAMVLAWIVAVRWGVGVLTAVPGLTWAALAATLAASIWLYRRLAAPSAVAFAPEPARPAAVHDGVRADLRYVTGMFVVSGFAALMYQVIFSKALALVFGSTAIATYTVLAVYMAGMALGAWLGGWIAARRTDALRLYAWCELGIGAYCIATPLVFQGIQALYVGAATGVPPDIGWLTGFRVILGAVALAVPTVLMGATLPVLARFFETRAAALGVSVARLYGANTAGAALGALATGYWVIPALGMWKSTLAAAALNFGVAWLALALLKKGAGRAVTPPGATASIPATGEASRLGAVALAVLAAGGVVTLALEVLYIHLLAVVAGNSVYAFSLMLFTFLSGLGAGAEVARRLLGLKLSVPLLLAWFEFGLAAAILGGIYLWEALPAYFASFEHYPVTRTFGAREMARGLACFVAMFPPAVMIGALYPLAMECVGKAYPAAPIVALGRAAALNTAGNIVGVLAAGFWLLPQLGALRSVQGIALASLALGAMVLMLTSQRRRLLAWAPATVVLALLVAQPRAFDYTALASGANVYFRAQGFGRVIDHAESADGGLTTVTAAEGPGKQAVRVLLTNGKFQGTNDLGGEVQAQIGFASAPLLHTDARERALVIGYGTGMSARVLHDAGFGQVDIVELSGDIVRLADAHFGDINGRVSARPGVRTYVTDGRNFLLLQENRYDLVSMEISSIWFAGAASLYNREFYRLVKRRLQDGGVLQQWMQLHHIEPIDMLYIIGSVRSEFRHVWIYFIGGQGIIVASDGANRSPAPGRFSRLGEMPSFTPLMKMLDGHSGNPLDALVMGPEGADAFLSSFGLAPGYWVSTDDNLFLEYHTPRGNVLNGDRSLSENLRILRKFGARPHERARAEGRQ